MSLRSFRWLRVVFVVVCSLPLLAAGPDRWTPELAMKVKRVGSVRVSPDGERVAFVVGRAVAEGEDSHWISHIWVARGDGAGSFQLTRGSKSATSPRWSPDGRWLAFLSSRGSGEDNLWRIRVDGGEAEQITDEKGGVQGFEWAPDGSRIAFLMAEPDEEQEEARKEKRDWKVIDGDFRLAHIHLVELDKKEGAYPVRRVTLGPYSVGGAFGGGMDWSPDGKTIVFAHVPTPRVNDWPKADLSVLDVSSGETSPLVATAAAEGQPLYSPDGRWIAYTASDVPPSWGFTSRVHVIPAAGGAERPLAESYDRQPDLLGWSPDGSHLLISETYRTVRRLQILYVDGRDPVWVTPQDKMVSGTTLNRSGTHAGFVSETPDRAPEAFVTQTGRFSPLKVSEVQDLPDIPIGRTEVIRWKSRDGMEIEGLLTYPVGFEPGTRVPLLVIVHGGPTGVFVQGFIGSRGAYPIAAFASAGYAVLRCNVRGSSGYGRGFRYANYEDWGGGDYHDIMSGVDHVIRMGVADADRLGVMGWSYGGYMTSWIITRTDRFKAASVGAGVTNLMSFTGTADIPGFIPDYFGGEYWDVFEKWASHSAMFSVKGVSTPTLIQHGERDLRVPVSQGYELYNALKRQSVNVKMVVYPRQPHGLREPKFQLHAMQENLDWFDRWLKAPRETGQTSGMMSAPVRRE